MREESGKECPDFGKWIIFSWWEDNYISQYKKRCKWDQWTMVKILWRVWRIWMMSKACGEINASANLKRVKK